MGLVSCAPSVTSSVPDLLGTEVAALRRDLARQESRIEELSNRLFVLADRLAMPPPVAESQVAPTPTTLKVVKLLPDSPPAGDQEPEETPEAPGPTVDIRLNGAGELTALPVTPMPPSPKLGDRADAEKQFEQALAAYKDGQVELAHQRFAQFLKRFPTHPYADNAVFWMGECRFDARDYGRAVAEYAKVLKKFPKSNKAADALFKLGVAYERLGEGAKARQVFEAVVATYARSAWADLARSHLTTLGAATARPIEEGSTR